MLLPAYCGPKLGRSLQCEESAFIGAARVRNLQIAPTFHGFQHGHFVGVFQVRAYGNPDADSRDAYAQRL